MKKKMGYCNKCGHRFSYELIHNGFNATTYAYCDSCGKTLFLNEHYKKIPPECLWFFKTKGRYEKISNKLEPFLERCKCGGKFTRLAKPRCPHCKEILLAQNATDFISKNASKGAIDSNWRISWSSSSIYAIIIESNVVEDNWVSGFKRKLIRKKD